MTNKLNIICKKLFDSTNEENSVIASEIVRLLNKLKPNYKVYFPEIQDIIIIAKKHILNDCCGEIGLVFKRISLNGLIDKRFLHAFICCEYDQNRILSKDKKSILSVEMFEQYKALVLIVVIRQLVNNDVESRIKKMCNEIRQLACGGRFKLTNVIEPYLPNILILELDTLLYELRKLTVDTDLEKSDASIHRQLSALYVPLNAAVNDSIGSSRIFGDNKQSKLLTHKLANIDNNDSYIYSILDEVNNSKNQHEREESAASIEKRIYLISDASNLHYVVKKARATAIVTNTRRREMHLPCDLFNTTTFEVSTFLTFISQQNKTDLLSCEKLLLISIMLGVSIDEVRNTEVAFNPDKSILGVIRVHKLPTHKILKQEKYDGLLPNITDSFVIPLPKKIVSNLNNLAFKDVTNENCKEYLKCFNKRFGTFLTKEKIANFLKQTFTSQNKSLVIQSIISSVNLQHFPALYYYQVSLKEIIELHNRYLNYLDGHIKNASLFIPQVLPESVKSILGSPLKVSLKLLNAIFDTIQNRVNELLRKKKKKFSCECHNLFTAFTLLVINISSGFRPVNGGPGKLSEFNLSRCELWISDKEMQTTDTSRVIILPTLCTKIIEKYLNYIHKCIVYYGDNGSVLCHRYKESISSEKYLTFFIENNKIIETSPAYLEKILKDILPLQLNWYRHYIYSYLQEEKIDHEYLNAFMGHSATGGKTFNITSSCSFQEMYRISDCINKLLIKLEIGG